jgi:thioredoxin-dependent peroxiredoxin
MAKVRKTQPEVGRKAPAFALMATGGREITLGDFAGKKNLVLYFYPKDGTPGCATEACGFRDVHERLEEHDTVVLGVSCDALDAHEKFSARHGLPFALLSDSGKSVSEAYGVYGKKSFMGREFFGIHRTTFVIDKKGTIRRIDRKVDVKQHPNEILDFVKTELA